MKSPAPKEPTPFEKFKAAAAQIVSVPREEMRRREDAWKKGRSKKAKP